MDDEFTERREVTLLCLVVAFVLTDSASFASIDFVAATQMAVVNKGLGVELGVIGTLHCQEL